MASTPRQAIRFVSPIAGVLVGMGPLEPGKLRLPALTDGLVLRPRLHLALDDAVERGSVLIAAPAGSGKTQLVAAWARHQRHPREVAWVTLDDEDRDPARFLTYVLAAIAGTSAGRRAMDGLWLPAPGSELPPTALAAISRAMAALSAEVILVLDDMDAIAASATGHLLERVFRYPPDRVRPVLIGRAQPALNHAKLVLRGHLTVLDGRNLEFSRDETAEFLAAHGVVPDEAHLEAVQTYAAGWVTGIRGLTGLLRAGMPLNDLTGAAPALIGDYLVAEVIEGLPADQQDFLGRATVVDTICGDLADAVTGRPGGARRLEELARSHVFLEPIPAPTGTAGDGRTWYRWQPMFAAVLQARLRRGDSDVVPELHLRAARWHQGHGSMPAAVRHAVAGGDLAGAAELFGECWLDLVVAGESSVVRSLLDLFDERWRASRPELTVVCAFVRLQDRDFDRACGCAEQAIDLSAGLPSVRRLAVDVMATVVRLHVSSMSGQDEPGLRDAALDLLERLRRRHGYLPEAERIRRATLQYHVGTFESSRWMYAESLEHLSAALADATSLGLAQLALRARAQMALVEFYSGHLDTAYAAAREVVVATEPHGSAAAHALAAALSALGAVEFIRGDLGNALEHLRRAEEVSHPLDVMSRFRTTALMHFALLTAGNVVAARREMQTLQSLAAQLETPAWTQGMLSLAEAQQLVAESADVEVAPEGDLLEEGAAQSASRLHSLAWRAEVLLRSGRPEEALASVARVLTLTPGWPIHVLALIVASLANDRLGAHDAALELLDRALGEASPERIVYPFLRGGSRLPVLLRELLDRGTSNEGCAVAILDRLTARAAAGTPPPYAEPLTVRELEVLRALQGTATNGEIARRLYVSANTLRTHLKHINQKLGTSSRRAAVARARELALI